jgi:hypothetical protein
MRTAVRVAIILCMFATPACGTTGFANRPLTNVVVRANVISRCVAQDGNVLEVSGNASGIKVIDNVLRGNGGAALNITGGTKPPHYTRWELRVRNVVVSGNRISDTTGKYALGLYIQASQGVPALGNTVTVSAYGLYVASEYTGVSLQNITIAGNVVTDNAKAGIWIGTPYHRTTVVGATVTGNVAERNGVDDPSHQPAGALYQYAGGSYTGFDTYRAATHQDARSTFGPPFGSGR